MSANVLVTGATGMVGWHVARHLLDMGYNITGLVRPTSAAEKLSALEKQPRFRLVRVRLDEIEKLAAVTLGHDAVIHAAGSVDPLGARQEIFAANVTGTDNMLEAAIANKVKQFIHISSLSVITGQEDCYSLSEDAPLRYCGEPYADSKVEAEKVVAKAAGRIATTILRPGFIYGPGERAWMPRLIRSLANRQVLLIDGGNKETNLIYIENLCMAVEKSLLNERAFGRTYNLTDGERITKKQLFDTICTELALPPVTKTINRGLARLVCEAVSKAAPALPAAMQMRLSRFSRAAFRLAGVNQGFDISRAVEELDYKDRIPFEIGMPKTLQTLYGSSSRSEESLRV